jgi:hypothetical protein
MERLELGVILNPPSEFELDEDIGSLRSADCRAAGWLRLSVTNGEFRRYFYLVVSGRYWFGWKEILARKF